MCVPEIVLPDAVFLEMMVKGETKRAIDYWTADLGGRTLKEAAMERMLKGYLDLITVTFMSHFGRSPMYFFGGLGTLMFLFGGGTTVWIIAAKLYKQFNSIPLRPVADQPMFYLAMLAIVLGVMLFLAGFLGELINRASSDRNKYLIDKNL
jgi:hypothetical protein